MTYAAALVTALALLAAPTVDRQDGIPSGRGVVRAEAERIVASDVAPGRAAALVGRRVRIRGDLVRLGLPEIDENFGVSDDTGIVPLDLDPHLTEDPAFVEDLLDAHLVDVIGIVELEARDPSDHPAPRVTVSRAEDIVLTTPPPYALLAQILGALALALLIAHLITRKRDAERRATEIGEFTREMNRREEILEAVGYGAELLLRRASWQDSLPEALRRIGLAAEITRVSLYTVNRSRAVPTASRVAEWIEPSVVEELGAAAASDLDMGQAHLPRWRECFLRNEVVMGSTENLPHEERLYLESRGLRSIIAVPVEVAGALGGLLLLADHRTARDWPTTIREALLIAARMIGAAIERRTTETALAAAEEELRRAHRIEAMGHLAAGIAHEINTPIQYIGGNLEFLDESFADLRVALQAYRALLQEASTGPVLPGRVAEITRVIESTDIDFIFEEAPRASSQALDGVRRVSEIVKAMKEFSHPGASQCVPTNVNQAIISTTTVARNEWKYVAELVTELDPDLPMVPCLPGELNQAILNLVVNAAHAIADRQQAEGHHELGVITVATARVGEWVEIRVGDTGAGIPEEHRDRVFDPFFTTKEVGRGTGQGLTLVHSIIVDRHGGTVFFETEGTVGTTFVVRLPCEGRAGLSEAA